MLGGRRRRNGEESARSLQCLRDANVSVVAIRRDARIQSRHSGMVAGVDEHNEEDVARKTGDGQGMRTWGKKCGRRASDDGDRQIVERVNWIVVNASLLFT